ncbi:general amino acid permease 1 [Thelephora terrestris]|uniref:General amino acid permease 1 n=1 Tax=Thelephora terrestris TaxID=56493 RepID=A0A9P6HE77_9AGAM|nr:general amino acid permease 1 [Thelephora terrestris]
MSDIEAPAVVYVNTNEKKDDSSSSSGNWSYTAGGSRDPDDMVRRRLKQRHIQMIAIAGTFGTGLFLNSGYVLATAGPAGALIAYILVGSVSYATLCAVSELAAYAPISGSFPLFAARWVDPALGFAIGWNYFYTAAIGVPGEITASSILITYWDSNFDHLPIYIAVVILFVIGVNFLGARYFGEAEFTFAIIKLTMLTGLILLGLIVDLGGGPDHDRRGFRYWKNPGAFNQLGLEPTKPNLDRFLAIMSSIVQAAFGFSGIEIVAVAASETENPRRNVVKAVRRVFWRIFLFYICGTLIIGMTVPSNDPRLLRPTGTAAQSPYIIAMERAGIKILPSIVNAGIFTSALSASSSFMFTASRILYGLGLRGLAPRWVSYCTKGGLPIAALAICSCFPWLAFMAVKSGSAKVFTWFINISTLGTFIGWWTINLTFLRFWAACRVQHVDRNDKSRFAYKSPLQPYLGIWAMVWTTFFILINGFTVFYKWDVSKFLTAYINIPIYIVLYFGYKIVCKSKIPKLKDVDLVTNIPTMEETERPEIPPTTIWGKIADVLF